MEQALNPLIFVKHIHYCTHNTHCVTRAPARVGVLQAQAKMANFDRMKRSLFLLTCLLSYHIQAEKNNLTQLLVAFKDSLGNAKSFDPNTTSFLASRLLRVKESLKSYDDLSSAVREQLSLDDLNRYVSYATLAANIELSSWTDIAVAQMTLFTASLTLVSSILAEISSSFGLASGILATIITLEAADEASPTQNSTSTTRVLLAQTVAKLAMHRNTAIGDGKAAVWLTLLKKALKMAAAAAAAAEASRNL